MPYIVLYPQNGDRIVTIHSVCPRVRNALLHLLITKGKTEHNEEKLYNEMPCILEQTYEHIYLQNYV